jgi:hypothetical protein
MDHPTSILENHEFVVDCARYAEGLLSEKEVKKKHHFDDDTWARLGEDEALIEAIEAEKVRRIRDGSTKRERAQQLVVKAPDVLGDIMLDASASPKHRIDASKTLDQFAGNGAEAARASERFVITINLGADHVEHYDKSIAINPNDTEPKAAPQELVVAVPAKKSMKIAKKPGEDGDGPI